jgi:hypothetical protein
MNKYAIAAQLDELQSEGRVLRESRSPDNRARTTLWFARALDSIAMFLPAESELWKTLVRQRDEFVKNEELTALQPQALMAIQFASDLNRARRDERMTAEIREQINAIAIETYGKSTIFRGTLALLVATIGFAFLGIFQLNNLKIDVRERAEQAAKKAEQEINDQKALASKAIASVGTDARQEVEKQLRTELQAHLNDTKQKMTVEAQAHIDDLKRQKAPELEAALITARTNVSALQGRVSVTQKATSDLEERLNLITRDLDRIRKTGQGSSWLERLSAFLDRARGYVAGEIIVILLTLGISLFGIGLTLRRT